jgi:hypothetical protein
MSSNLYCCCTSVNIIQILPYARPIDVMTTRAIARAKSKDIMSELSWRRADE